MELTHEQVSEFNVTQIAELALQLWPESTFRELFDDFSAMIGDEHSLVLLIKSANDPIGFAHISTRNDYVEGAQKLPVAYLEGIYVVPEKQKTGVGQYMLSLAEDWAMARGLSQLASDVEIHNVHSQSFHQKTGFKEVNRVVCYIKDLRKEKEL